MNTLICAGGSSQRVLASILHLCAAGLGPPEMRVVIVDPDGANGNGAEVRELVDKYVQCQSRFAAGLGTGLNLFGTKLDLLDAEFSTPGLKVWSVVASRDKLADVINYDNLPSSETPQDVAHLFFTPEEIRMPLDQGFRGHTAVGAAAMSLVSLSAGDQPWKQIVEKIGQDVTQTGGARVMVVGSVFGGTGASAIHPLVRFLRSTPKTNKERLKIAATALAPYFRFDDSTAAPGTQASALAAQAAWFPLRTRSAVEFYRHLQDNNDFDFDAIYWIGDNAPIPVDYAEGGSRQRNPAHFVDLLAALAALDFFRQPEAVKGNFYAGSGPNTHRELAELNVVDWTDLPLRGYTVDEIRQSALRMVLAGAMHTGFFMPLFQNASIDSDPSCVRWYYQRFARKDDHLTKHVHSEDLALLTSFFTDHHLRWWAELTKPKNVFLFNNSAFLGDGSGPSVVQLDRLRNLQGADSPAERTSEAIDDFVEKMDDVPSSMGGQPGVAGYLSLLAHASDLYIQDVYKMTTSKSQTESRR